MELPGQELVERGIEDLRRGEATAEALLVSIGATRLRATGLDVPEPLPEPELALYRLLGQEHGADAYGRYNALVRQLISYEQAAECAM